VTTTTYRPLADVRVVELGHIVAGPTAGMICHQLGAEVIKIEPPDRGDQARHMPALGSGMFPYLNRGKKSVAIDLKHPAGREAFLRLVPTVDVVVTNFAPGVAKRLGVDFPALAAVNPRLVYAQIGGFLPGPYHDRPALDEVVQMMSGLAYMTGPAGRPLRAGAPVIDMTASLFAVVGILSALLAARTTGRGRYLESALYEASLFYLGQQFATYELIREPSIPFPERGAAGRNGWGVYDIFTTADQRRLFLAITSDKHWSAFCRRFGLGPPFDGPAYGTNADRVAHRDTLIPALRELLSRWRYADLEAALLAEGIPHAPVRAPEDVLADPATVAGMDAVHYRGHTLHVPRLPLAADGEAAPPLTEAVPELGQDTLAVLTAAGLDPAAVADLAERGIVRIAAPPAPPEGGIADGKDAGGEDPGRQGRP
jgi:crotonobetainyl-CoA:carnitine CoA-transferase CaiB-like acyl-CoA transferase